MNADIRVYARRQSAISNSQTFMRRLIRLSVLLLFCVSAYAQDPSITTPVAAPPLTPVSPFRPMTREERWQDYKQQNFGSSGAFFQTFVTGLSDSAGNVPHWDHGAAGFAEHQGSEFARFTMGGTVHSTLAAVLHQDTRFFPCACRGVVHRSAHALGRTLFSYTDSGHMTLDISGLAGIYAGPMLMTYWYPSNYTPLGYGIRQGDIAAGITASLYLLREFSPDIKRAVNRRISSKKSRTP